MPSPRQWPTPVTTIRPGRPSIGCSTPEESAAGGNVLTLTPVSDSGGVTGKAVTRKVLLPTKTTVKKLVKTKSLKTKSVKKRR